MENCHIEEPLRFEEHRDRYSNVLDPEQCSTCSAWGKPGVFYRCQGAHPDRCLSLACCCCLRKCGVCNLPVCGEHQRDTEDGPTCDECCFVAAQAAEMARQELVDVPF